MSTTEWLNKYGSIRDKLTCKVDLGAHFIERVIGSMAVDVLDIGTVHFPTGQIFACDPLVELEDIPSPLQTIPAGTYPVKICVVSSKQYGDRYACVRAEVSREKPVCYELDMAGNENLDAAPGDDDYFGFDVDAGMGCIVDIQTQAVFKTYWAKRLEEDPDIDPYNDLFCDLLEESARAYPKYQGGCGDWLNWTVPDTDCSLSIFSSGWDDGYHPVYFGYDAKGEICVVYVRFIDIEISYRKQDQKCNRTKGSVMEANAGEVYTIYDQHLKRHTACQVAYIAPSDTVSKESWAVALSLDWVGDAPLAAEEPPHPHPLYEGFMYWSRDFHLLRVPSEVLPQYTLIGTLPSFIDQPYRFYGGWSDGYDACFQVRWQVIPEERRRAFKEAMEGEEKTEVGGIPVEVSSHRVMDQYAPFDSALELRALPCLFELIYQRWYPDLLEFLGGNPFISELTLLNRGQRTLDLWGTSIRRLMLDMTGLEELWLCEGMEQLLFQNKGLDVCIIHVPEDGSDLTLQLIGECCPHTELPNLRGLHGIELKDSDPAGLVAAHPHLKELRLWGASGNLQNFSTVGAFQELTNLFTFDLFGFGADDIPTPEQMSELRWFWMTSLSEDVVKAAKQLWKSKPGTDLWITKPWKPEWLVQNLDSPFRGWDSAEHIPAVAAKKVVNQYHKTRSLLMKLATESGEDAQTQAMDAVAAYTQTFNKMGFIETEKRDEVYMALWDILDALPDGTLQRGTLIEKFEQLRDF